MVKKLTISFVVLLAAFLAYPSGTWSDAAEKAIKSVVRIVTNHDGNCTGVVVGREYVATAVHCIEDDATFIKADNLPAKVVLRHDAQEIVVLYVQGLSKPPMAMAAGRPRVAEEVATLGYGLGIRNLMFRHFMVSTPMAYDLPQFPGEWMLVDDQFVSGQSGGPIFNIDGELVSIVVASNIVQGFGVGVGTDILRESLESIIEP